MGRRAAEIGRPIARWRGVVAMAGPPTRGCPSGSIVRAEVWGSVAKAPKATLWRLDPHSHAKHAILRRYLQAWTPILTRGGFGTIAYIDAFAGPGLYDSGEDGSPLIALKAALSAPVTGTMLFLFVEEKPARAEHLRALINDLALP